MQYFTGNVRPVQLIPSGLVIIRLVPLALTATNKPLPYTTDLHWLSAADVRLVQVIPSAVACDTTLTLNNDAIITAITPVRIYLLNKLNSSSDGALPYQE